DVTAIREHREKMRQSDERFQMLAKATNDAIWDWDFASKKLWWNEGIETLFGYSRDELSFSIEEWEKMVHPEDRAAVLESLEGAIASERDSWTNEYRFARKDGTYAYVLDRGYLIKDGSGKPVRMIGGMTDLTERKDLEAKLLQSQKM